MSRFSDSLSRVKRVLLMQFPTMLPVGSMQIPRRRTSKTYPLDAYAISDSYEPLTKRVGHLYEVLFRGKVGQSFLVPD